MSARVLRWSLRAVPPPVRAADGDALIDLAEELIEGGRSSGLRESAGIVRLGIARRMRLNIDNIRTMPWAAALWRLALPIAAVQLTMMLFASPYARFSDAWLSAPGRWWPLVLALSVGAIIGASRGDRRLLGGSGLALLTIYVLDTWGPGGSMLGNASHAADFSMSLGADEMLSPVPLIVLPSIFLMTLAAATRMPESVRGRRSVFAWIALPGAALLLMLTTLDLPPVLMLGRWAIVAFAAGFAFLIVSSFRGNRADALAASLLLLSQAPLIGLTLAFWQFWDGPVGVIVWSFFALLALPFVCAAVIARLAFRPYRKR